MAIISKINQKKFRGYGNTQFHYAMTYVVITFVVLLILNIYCSNVSQMVFYQSKEASMIEKCHIASDEISAAEVLNPSTVSSIVSQIESLKVTRMLVTDQRGLVLYDSQQTALGQYALLPEILQALGKNDQGSEGNDVFSWKYRSGVMDSHAATPITYYGSIIGCVYMTDHDTAQGALIHSLQLTVFQITLVLEIIVLLFSLAFASAFSRRVRKIMASIRIIQEGDYTHKVTMGGNDELTILGDEINDLTERLNTSEQKRRRFVSDASHELKTPLATVRLALSLEEDCPVLILEDDLYQIVFNLMENGIKYNHSGGTLYVTLRHEDDNAMLIVRDTGVGIPTDAVDHIFERFYRVDKARSRATGGSGLGLAIVRAIVQRNRGDIQVQSTPGEGTCFTVTFPSFETEVDKE